MLYDYCVCSSATVRFEQHMPSRRLAQEVSQSFPGGEGERGVGWGWTEPQGIHTSFGARLTLYDIGH